MSGFTTPTQKAVMCYVSGMLFGRFGGGLGGMFGRLPGEIVGTCLGGCWEDVERV